MSLPFKNRGVIILSGPDGTREVAAFTCKHCQCIVPAPPGAPVWNCRHCWAVICETCASKLECTPFEKKLEAIERRDAALRSYGLA